MCVGFISLIGVQVLVNTAMMVGLLPITGISLPLVSYGGSGLLASALAGYESAMSEAQRQQVYLERIAQPSRPDRAQEPRRLRSVFITFLLGLVVYGIASMVLAGVREHMD